MFISCRFIIASTSAEVKILDYSNSQIVTINNGLATLQTGSFKLIHIIEPDRYQQLVDDLHEIIQQNVNKSHILYPFLSHELNNIESHLDRLKPRVRKSLNFIGTAWKWIAGNPDHEDFQIISNKINNVLVNNNKQVIINKLSTEKINELTKITNEIVKNRNENTYDNMIKKLKYNLDILKEEIINIQFAIHWAKVGIVNSLILTPHEINIVKDVITKNKIPFVNLEQTFEFAEVKIASNNNYIIYIITIPITDISCNKLLIKPVKFGKYVNKIDFENILICNNSYYGISKLCKSYNNITICNESSLTNLDSNKCLTNLIRGRSSNCSVIDNRHVPTVEEISSDVILLNQFNGTIYINGEPQGLNGTYLLHIRNSSVNIEDKIFNSFEATHLQPLPAILQPRLQELNVEEILSLDMLKELQINNTETIDILSNHHKLGLAINFGLSSALVSSVIFLIIKTNIFSSRRKTNVAPPTISLPVINTSPSIHLSMPEPPEVNNSKSIGVRRIQNIPFF